MTLTITAKVLDNFTFGTSAIASKVIRNVQMSGIVRSGTEYVHAIQNVGTTEEELAQVADLGTPGYCLVINHGSNVNFVEIGAVTGQYTIKLKGGGEFALFRMTGTSLFAKSTGGTQDIEYIIFED